MVTAIVTVAVPRNSPFKHSARRASRQAAPATSPASRLQGVDPEATAQRAIRTAWPIDQAKRGAIRMRSSPNGGRIWASPRGSGSLMGASRAATTPRGRSLPPATGAADRSSSPWPRHAGVPPKAARRIVTRRGHPCVREVAGVRVGSTWSTPSSTAGNDQACRSPSPATATARPGAASSLGSRGDEAVLSRSAKLGAVVLSRSRCRF